MLANVSIFLNFSFVIINMHSCIDLHKSDASKNDNLFYFTYTLMVHMFLEIFMSRTIVLPLLGACWAWTETPI